MKKIVTVLLATFLLCAGICFAEDSVNVHREYKRQLVKVIEYEEWGYNTWLEIPKGWHVIDITANNRVVIIVLEAD